MTAVVLLTFGFIVKAWYASLAYLLTQLRFIELLCWLCQLKAVNPGPDKLFLSCVELVSD